MSPELMSFGARALGHNQQADRPLAPRPQGRQNKAH